MNIPNSNPSTKAWTKRDLGRLAITGGVVTATGAISLTDGWNQLQGETGRVALAQGGEIAQVVHWIDGGELLLAHGERIVLQDIFLPTTASMESQEGRRRLVAILSSIFPRVVGRNIQVFPETTVVTNSTQRKFAHVYLEGGVWLQHELVQRGAAWVMPHPLARERLLALYEAEYEARRSASGLWGSSDFQVFDVNDQRLVPSRNYVVFGRVASVLPRSGDLVITFDPAASSNGQSATEPIYVVVNEAAAQDIKRSGHNIPTGRLMRVRGWLSALDGRRITVLNPAQIELIDDARS